MGYASQQIYHGSYCFEDVWGSKWGQHPKLYCKSDLIIINGSKMFEYRYNFRTCTLILSSDVLLLIIIMCIFKIRWKHKAWRQWIPMTNFVKLQMSIYCLFCFAAILEKRLWILYKLGNDMSICQPFVE